MRDDLRAVRELHVEARETPADRRRPGSGELTGQELRTLRALSHGLSEREAAVVLGYTAWGIADHMTNARRLLRAKTNAQAVAEAFRRGLIT
jgi:DNA-binding CsgD family transcriptional regulator